MSGPVLFRCYCACGERIYFARDVLASSGQEAIEVMHKGYCIAREGNLSRDADEFTEYLLNFVNKNFHIYEPVAGIYDKCQLEWNRP